MYRLTAMTRLRSLLLGGAVLVVLASATTLALASRRISAEQAAYSAPSVGRCTPATLNRSAVLPGTTLAASPLPGSYDASAQTQVSLLGAPASAIAGIRVSGSQTGSHSGRLRGYSQGDGASWVPSKPFLPGETVTVHGSVRTHSKPVPFAFHFVIAHEDPVDYAAVSAAAPPRDYNEMQHFASRPELQPPQLVVSQRSTLTSAGDMFAAPYAGPGPSGPMIFEESGNLVWFHPLAKGVEATNLQVQQLGGQPVLTWWQGHIPPQGFGQGEEIIADGSYREIDHVHGGNGYPADLHEFHITSQGTAMLHGVQPDRVRHLLARRSPRRRRDRQPVPGNRPRDRPRAPRMAQPRPRRPRRLLQLADDRQHDLAVRLLPPQLVDQLASGRTLLSARNTSALYELSTVTGQVLASIGGKRSNFKLAAGAATAYQHDATVLPNGTISVFDNGAVPKVHAQSRGVVLAVTAQANTDTVLAQYEHPGTALSVGQPGQHADPGKRRRVHRLGRRAVLLGVQLVRPAPLRRPHARLLSVLPRAIASRGPARRAKPRRSPRRPAGAPADRVCELERRHAHRQLARAGRSERAAAHGRRKRDAHRL